MATETKGPEYHLPVRPYSPIDALNRAAAAHGSPGYAMATGYANYNGHHVTLTWNAYRGYYVAEYYWAERIVIARGDFARCLAAVLSDYNRGALGASASVFPRSDDAEAIALCDATPLLVRGSLWVDEPGGCRALAKGDWYTWRHAVASRCARDSANPRMLVLIFDWPLLQAATDERAYECALKAKYGRVYQ